MDRSTNKSHRLYKPLVKWRGFIAIILGYINKNFRISPQHLELACNPLHAWFLFFSSYDALKKCIRKIVTGERKNIEDPVELMNVVINEHLRDTDEPIKDESADVDLAYLKEEILAYEVVTINNLYF